MAVTLNEFIQEYNEKFVEFPGDNAGHQCVDIVQYWAQNLGFPRFTGNAVNIYNEADGHYTQIANTPTGVPQPGDIVVWEENAEAGTGPDGHVGIFVSGNAESLVVFDQNAPAGTPCHETSFASYAGVLGWLRPTSAPAPSPAPTSGTATTLRECNVRSEPNTTAPLAGSETLAEGVTFDYYGTVDGEEVTENGVTTNVWLVTHHDGSEVDDYVWSGNVKLN